MNSRRTAAFALIITLLAALSVVTEVAGLRVVGALLLVFVLPGYAILAAWFPNRLSSVSSGTLLTLALSIATVGIGGLILNRTTWGLQTATWTIWCAGIAVTHGLVALVRRPVGQSRWRVGLQRGQVITLGLALILVFGAFGIARFGADTQPREPFTQLWMLPADEQNAVRVGVRNEEGRAITYRLTIIQAVPVAQTELTLAPGDTWEGVFSFLPEGVRTVSAELYRVDAPDTVYRSVHLSLTETTE